MAELRLVGLHDDGEHVVLEGPDGQRFRLPIDEPLRAAVRRDRPQLEQARAAQSGVLPPREIQARIRAGATAEEVAEASGTPVEHVRRYEGAVLDERAFVAEQARSTRVGHDTGAPALGDLVSDRLATRGVQQDSIRWDASRGSGGPWTVEVEFEVAGAQRSARWTFDVPTRTVRAVDDEARWLSETEIADEPIPRRHLAAVPHDEPDDADVHAAIRPLLATVDGVPAPDEPAEGPAAEPVPSTDDLLADLAGRRGVRQPLLGGDEADDGDDDVFEGFGPQHAFDFDHPGATAPGDVPAAHPPASRPDLAVDAQVLSLPSGRRRARPADEGTGPLPDTAAGTGEGALERPERPVGRDEAHADPGAAPADAPDDPSPLARPRGRRGRASVPSWDEIVFGAKPD